MRHQPAAESGDPLLTSAQVQARLGVSRSFVSEHRAELGGVRVGRWLRFEEAGLARYLERQRIRDDGAAAAPVEIAEEREQRRPKLAHTSEINKLTGLPWGVYESTAGKR